MADEFHFINDIDKGSRNISIRVRVIRLWKPPAYKNPADYGSVVDEVSNAVDHVQSGNNAMLNARKTQKSTRKWMFIAIVILLLIMGIMVLAVLKPWNNK